MKKLLSKKLENEPTMGSLVYELNLYKTDLVETKEQVVSDVEEVISLGKEVLTEAESKTREMDVKYSKLSDELVEALNDIKTNGLKGDPGVDADEKAIEERITAKIPKAKEIAKQLPTKKEIVEEVIKLIPENKPSLKIIQESIDTKKITEDVLEELEIDKIKEDLQKTVKLEVSRNKRYSQVSGGGFNNIQLNGVTVSTGLTNLNFTGPGANSITQSGNTVTVNISGGGGGGGGTPYAETPSGTVDGVNDTFTLAHTPDDGASVKVFLDGVAQYNGIDYTVSGDTITFSVAPANGSTIFAYYNDNSGSGSVSKFQTTQTLSSGNNTITHNLNLTSPYQAIVQILDATNHVVIPNTIGTFTTNSLVVNVSTGVTNAIITII